MTTAIAATARDVLARARDRGLTIATAESLTAGLVASTLATVPGASEVLVGGFVAYSARLKVQLLGVDDTLLAAGGTVQAQVAEQMAVGAARETGASLALSTTGVAGPGSSEGKPAGTVYIAVAVAADNGYEAFSCRLDLRGDRDEVRHQTVSELLRYAARALGGMRG